MSWVVKPLRAPGILSCPVYPSNPNLSVTSRLICLNLAVLCPLTNSSSPRHSGKCHRGWLGVPAKPLASLITHRDALCGCLCLARVRATPRGEAGWVLAQRLSTEWDGGRSSAHA